jgi:hypothetical protein
MPSVEHRQSNYLNRAENSRQPTRQRERAMKRFTSPTRMRNGSCPRSAASRHISVRVGICCRPPDGATRCPTASPFGTRSPGLPRPPPERELGQGFPPEPTHNTRTISPPINLTVPSSWRLRQPSCRCLTTVGGGRIPNVRYSSAGPNVSACGERISQHRVESSEGLACGPREFGPRVVGGDAAGRVDEGGADWLSAEFVVVEGRA